MGKPLVFNIQKYSVHDGEGIRTTVFFKGCPLRCKWCHNPESQSYRREILVYGSRCTGCGACIRSCPQGAVSYVGQEVWTDRNLCTACGDCLDVCVHNAREAAGREYEMRDLVRELEKDKMFYEQSGGGITISGGEALAQDMDYIEELMRRLHFKGYSVDVDTCGHVPYENIQRVLPYTDTFLYDIKLMDPEAHREYVGVDNQLILENLKRLSEDGGKINIRLPLIDGVNADDAHIDAVIDFLRENRINVYRVNLLKYHNTGSGKYAKLNRPYDSEGMRVPEGAWLNHVIEKFQQSGFANIQIGG
ncbi:MAG: glycyl-radical enzyme activating protein [Lachnospiraceae bacterium]|nr:glycyl-radical enzyme activating protein [Lachnospiraceae bacterium]